MSVDKDDPTHGRTIRAFCARKGFSLAFYHTKLRPQGLAPEEMRFPGSTIVRITDAAEREWDERMRQMNKDRAAQLAAEHEARAVLASRAGKAGAASPAHYSQQRKKRRAKVA